MKRREFVRATAAAGAALAVTPGAGAATPGAGAATGRRAGAVPASRELAAGWRFLLGDVPGAEAAGFDDAGWSAATLPHTARIESVVTGPPGSDTWQWQGTCWYRRTLRLRPQDDGRKVLLLFDAAMNVADAWLDGAHLGRHMGGWMPFGFDLTGRLRPGADHVLAVRLDNRDNPVTGPKPLAQLDFNSYHGLYRGARLVVKDRLHITDPILADRPGSGGLLVTVPEASNRSAAIDVQVHVRNDGPAARTFRLRVALEAPAGRAGAEDASGPVRLAAGEDREIELTLRVADPALWSPRTPDLYGLRAELVEDGRVVDAEETRVGIRRIEVSADGFRINGERMFLRGTNRHQEYPYVGYALSDAAQWRDAKKIKDAGFDYVRLSHYAHAPAFMDACDELGLVVMNCIPGWQYFNRDDPEFTRIQYENCRRLVRRDRNRPCVILWEVSLNETEMPEEFIRTTHAIAHEELPGDQCFTCGWTEGYDVFIQARQHGGCKEVIDRPCVVSEYGDWEYYAQNAGLRQDAWADLAPDEANSRQMRWHGEAALLQQATNFQEAHNDNRKTIAFADGLWVMFDYNRGYAPDIESSGCADLFRIPKLSRAFFRSQRPPDEVLRNAESGPMAFVASWWTPDSSPEVRVFSNCEEVEIRLDGTPVGRRGPDADRISTHLSFPPFTFRLGRFRPGTLEAVGFVGGREVARHAVRTPGPVARLELALDEGGRRFGAQGKDVAFLYASLHDAAGTLVPDAWENVSFGAAGDLALIGTNPFSAEAGIASILLQTETAWPRGAVYALCLAGSGDRIEVLSAALGVNGDPEPYEVRVATDGGDPLRGAVHRAGPVLGAGRVRAALVGGGRCLAQADSATPKFRIPGSTAPDGPG